MTRSIAAAALAATFFLLQAGPADASASLCLWDPPVSITTPAGNVVTVYLEVATSSTSDLPYLQQVTSSYTAQRAYAGGYPVTQVALTVLVPNSPSGTFSLGEGVFSSSHLNPSSRLVSQVTSSGVFTTLQFSLSTP